MATADHEYTTTEARNRFAELVHRVDVEKERVLLYRRGRPVAAVIPVDHLEDLEHFEDLADVASLQAMTDEEKREMPLEEAWPRIEAEARERERRAAGGEDGGEADGTGAGVDGGEGRGAAGDAGTGEDAGGRRRGRSGDDRRRR